MFLSVLAFLVFFQPTALAEVSPVPWTPPALTFTFVTGDTDRYFGNGREFDFTYLYLTTRRSPRLGWLEISHSSSGRALFPREKAEVTFRLDDWKTFAKDVLELNDVAVWRANLKIDPSDATSKERLEAHRHTLALYELLLDLLEIPIVETTAFHQQRGYAADHFYVPFSFSRKVQFLHQREGNETAVLMAKFTRLLLFLAHHATQYATVRNREAADAILEEARKLRAPISEEALTKNAAALDSVRRHVYQMLWHHQLTLRRPRP